MNRNLTLGALAAVGALGAAAAPLASANSGAPFCASGNVVGATATGWNAGPQPVAVELDGAIAFAGTITLPRGDSTFPTPVAVPPGPHTVRVTIGGYVSPLVTLTCSPIVPQNPAETPGGGGATPQPPPDCATNLGRFPGAGPKHREAWGCPASSVKVDPPEPVRVCARDARLVIDQPDRTSYTRTYRGRVRVRNTSGVPLSGRLTVTAGPLQHFVRGERTTRYLSFRVSLRPGGTTSRSYVFGHPAEAYRRHVTTVARLTVCGRAVAADADTLVEP